MIAKPLVLVVGQGAFGRVIADCLTRTGLFYVACRGRDWLRAAEVADAIVVACRADHHAEPAEWALSHGKPLWVEKPLVLTELAACRLTTLAYQQPGLPILVDHTKLFHADYLTLRKAARDEGVAAIEAVTGGAGGPVRPEVSPLWDFGSHDVAVAIDLGGAVAGHVVDPRDMPAKYSCELTLTSGATAKLAGGPGWGSRERSVRLTTRARNVLRLFETELPATGGQPLENAALIWLAAINGGVPDPRLGLELGVEVVEMLARVDQTVPFRPVAEP